MAIPRLQATYLQDHHAGAVAGVALARRTAESNAGTPYGDDLAQLADEIEADKQTLEALMSGLAVSRDRAKDTAMVVGEWLGRLKPSGRWRSYSPLSRLLELDGLALGVTGKLGLWSSLRHVHGDVVAGIDLAALEARAERQRERIEGLRRRVAAEALRSD